MKIAFISYEYPPDTAFGGIATYVRQAAQMLQQRGHRVEVFAGAVAQACIPSMRVDDEAGVLVHRIAVRDRAEFSRAVGSVFAVRHQTVHFDVLEGPDCGADAAEAVRLVPEIPLALKLHTPRYVLDQIGSPLRPWEAQARWTLGALRRGKLPQRRAGYDRHTDPEYRHALEADEIVAPSQAIGQKVVTDWQLNSDLLASVPYPYIPAASLLNIPIQTHHNVVTFLGRLEVRKGVLDLVRAIPLVLHRYPQVKFRFVGPAWNSPQPGMNMQQYLESRLHLYQHALEFTGGIPLDLIPAALAVTDICVFPSIWESFGLVCTEAMAAGRGIVASNAGGMAELLDQGRYGHLVPPRSPRQIATAICNLLQNPEQRMRFGAQARDRVLSHYSLERIGALQEASYERAIARRAVIGARSIARVA